MHFGSLGSCRHHAGAYDDREGVHMLQCRDVFFAQKAKGKDGDHVGCDPAVIIATERRGTALFIQEGSGTYSAFGDEGNRT